MVHVCCRLSAFHTKRMQHQKNFSCLLPFVCISCAVAVRLFSLPVLFSCAVMFCAKLSVRGFIAARRYLAKSFDPYRSHYFYFFSVKSFSRLVSLCSLFENKFLMSFCQIGSQLSGAVISLTNTGRVLETSSAHAQKSA